MPILKVGAIYPNGVENAVFMVIGNAVRDAEDKPVGVNEHARVSVIAKEYPDGAEKMFVSINGWRRKAADVRAIRKGDSVLAVGVLKSSEWDGKKYYDLDADFVCISGVGRMRVPHSNLPPSNRPASHAGNAVDVSAEDFDEIGDDEAGELPF